MSMLGETIKNIKSSPKKTRKVLKKKKLKKYNPSPLGVVKKDLSDNLDDNKVKDWLSTVPGYLEGLTEIHGKPVKLYDYQAAHLLNDSKFRIMGKSRQTGASFSFSGEAYSKSQLKDLNTSIFISYNKDEASEKIITVDMLYESTPLAYKKKRIVDNKHSQVYRDQKGRVTRIISTAQRPPRGKGFNVDLYFDELAFWQFAKKIFTASVPVITRGTGTLTIASTPFGAKDLYYDILTDRITYPQFTRQYIPWWYCPDLCLDVTKAREIADGMSTEERVRRFANPNLKIIYNNMALDDFQQEFEIQFIDENASYFPKTYVDACVYGVDKDDFSYDEISDSKGMSVIIDKNSKYQIETKRKNIKFFLCKSLEELAGRVVAGEVSHSLYAGYDVGRKKDKAELIITEEIELNDSENIHVVRYVHQFDREKYDVQKHFLMRSMDILPIIKLSIDANGIGDNLAENLQDAYPDRVEKCMMTEDWKNSAAQILRIRFENQLMAIPEDHNLQKQIGSIKRKVSDTGHVRFDAEKDKEHHGDKLWALALAVKSGNDISPKANSRFSGEIIAGASRVLAGTGSSKIWNGGAVLPLSNSIYEGREDIVIPGLGALPAPVHGLVSPEVRAGREDFSWETTLGAFRMPIGIK